MSWAFVIGLFVGGTLGGMLGMLVGGLTAASKAGATMADVLSNTCATIPRGEGLFISISIDRVTEDDGGQEDPSNTPTPNLWERN